MKRPILAILSAATLLSGCATFLTPARCERALTGLQTAQEIVNVLQSRGVAIEIANKLANALVIGQIGVGAVCAGVS